VVLFHAVPASAEQPAPLAGQHGVFVVFVYAPKKGIPVAAECELAGEEDK